MRPRGSNIQDLTQESIERGLRGTFGRPLRWFDSIGSTNDEATAWALEGAPHGALVATDHQTAGRGRRGRGWFSEPGTAVQLSLIVRPRRPLNVMGLLTTAVGLACVEALEIAASIDARLKWPNDVVIGGRKLAGILVESHVAGPTLEFAVIGVGLNVRPPRGELPPDVAARATNVYAEIEAAGGTPGPGRVEILGWLLDAFERIYQHLGSGEGAAGIVERATKKSLVLGKEVTVTLSDGRTIEGTARRLLPSGALEIETGGEFRAVHAGEITRLRDA